MSTEPFATTTLGADIVVRFHDCSNRYFGDYHRISVLAVAELPLVVERLPPDLQKRVPEGETLLHFEKKLERMAVPTADIDRTRQELVENFLSSAKQYLLKEGFAESLLRRRAKEGRRTETLDFG